MKYLIIMALMTGCASMRKQRKIPYMCFDGSQHSFFARTKCKEAVDEYNAHIEN